MDISHPSEGAPLSALECLLRLLTSSGDSLNLHLPFLVNGLLAGNGASFLNNPNSNIQILY